MAHFTDLALGLTEAISSYMKAKFHAKLQRSENPIPFPPEWDFALLNQCDQAVNILLEAYSNPCEWPTIWQPLKAQSISHQDVTPWRAEDYVSDLTPSATGQNLNIEAKLMKKYPPIFEPTIYMMRPCIVPDKDGNILLWYLPGAMTAQYTVSYFFQLVSSAPEAHPRSVTNVGRYDTSGEITSHQQKLQKLAYFSNIFQGGKWMAETW
jgi:hypothetical protein